jgi:hypothetical protein
MVCDHRKGDSPQIKSYWGRELPPKSQNLKYPAFFNTKIILIPDDHLPFQSILRFFGTEFILILLISLSVPSTIGKGLAAIL